MTEHTEENFDLLLRRLIQHAQFTIIGNDTFDFNAFDDMAPNRQREMIRFAYLLHQRIQIALGTKQIHRSLDQKEERMRLGRELNRRSINDIDQ